MANVTMSTKFFTPHTSQIPQIIIDTFEKYGFI